MGWVVVGTTVFGTPRFCLFCEETLYFPGFSPKSGSGRHKKKEGRSCHHPIPSTIWSLLSLNFGGGEGLRVPSLRCPQSRAFADRAFGESSAPLLDDCHHARPPQNLFPWRNLRGNNRETLTCTGHLLGCRRGPLLSSQTRPFRTHEDWTHNSGDDLHSLALTEMLTARSSSLLL